MIMIVLRGCGGFRFPDIGQDRRAAIERHTDDGAHSRGLLEDGDDLVALPDMATDERGTFGRDIADRHAAGRQDQDGLRIMRIIGFEDEFDRLTGAARRDFEAPRDTPLGLRFTVGEIGASNGKRKLARHKSGQERSGSSDVNQPRATWSSSGKRTIRDGFIAWESGRFDPPLRPRSCIG